MSGMDRFYKRQKEKQSSTPVPTANGGMDRYYKKQYYNSLDTSGVNEKYINSFITDANNFLKTSEKEYGNIGWGNASSSYETKNNSWNELNSRSDIIKAWLYKNKNSLDDNTYKSINEALNGYSSSASSIIDAFKNAVGYYSQWDTEDAYNEWYKSEEERKALLNSNDFEYYSQIGANIENPEYDDARIYEYNLWDRIFKEDINNPVTFGRNNKDSLGKLIGGASSSADVGDVNKYYRYNLLTDDEASIYNYYLGKGDTQKAEEYLVSLDDTLRKREAGRVVENIGDSKFLQMVFAAGAGLDQFASGIANIDNYIKGTEADPTTVTQYASSEIRNNLGGFWGGAYDLTSTTFNMLPSVLVGGAPGLATMGTSVVGNAYSEMRNLGYDEWQSRGYATLVGAAETGLQYLLGGINKLGGKVSGNAIGKFVSKFDNALAKTAITLGGNMASEGLEEAIQTVLEPAFKALVTGEDFESPEWEEVLYSALLGALSAGVMEGPLTAVGTVMNNHQIRNEYGSGQADLVNEGIELGGEAGTLAEKYQAKLNKGKDLSGGQLNRLIQANEKAITSQDTATIKSATVERLTQLGEQGDINTLADVLVKQASGETLTRPEQNLIKESKFGQRVANELNPENISSGEYSSSWAEKLDTNRINPEEYSRLIANMEEADKGSTEAQVVESATKPIPESKTTPTTETIANEGLQTSETTTETVAEEEKTVTLAEASKKYGAQAQAMIHTYTEGQDVAQYDKAYQMAYAMGKSGVSLSYAMNSDSTSYLTENQRELAYEAGKSASETFAKEKDAKNKQAANGKTGRKKGTVKGEGVTIKDLKKTFNDTQNKAYKILTRIAEVTGYDIVLFKSGTDADGNFVGEQGSYKVSSNTIRIDINTGLNNIKDVNDLAKYVMLRTFTHEFTHSFEHLSPVEYNELRKAVFEALTEQGVDVNDLIETKMAQYKDETEKQAIKEIVDDAVSNIFPDTHFPSDYNARVEAVFKKLEAIGKDVNELIWERMSLNEDKAYDYASREVVAEAMTDILPDSHFIEILATKHQNLFQKLLAKLKEFLNSIKEYFKGLDPNMSTEANALKEEIDGAVHYVESIVELFDKAAVKAVETYQSKVAVKEVIKPDAKPIPSNEIITDGAVVTDGEGTQYSIRSMKHDIAQGQMFRDLMTYCGFTKDQVGELRTQLEDLVEYMNPFRDIVDLNETYGMEGRRYSPYKPNSDPLYTISLDFSTQCSKRLLTQYVIEQLQLRENRPMSAEEQMAIRDMLKEYGKVEKGLQVACVMCYVEAARLKAPKQIQKWLDDPATQMRNFFADKNPEFSKYIKDKQSDFKESKGYDRNATKKDMSAKDVKALNAIRPRLRSQYNPSAEEMAIIETASSLPNSTYLTAGNLADLSETHPEIYKAYTAFIRTATRSKALETDEPYYYGDSTRDNGNGIIVSDSFIEAVNRENGMRFSSWSDWRIQHLLDWITAVIDNSVRKASMHGYTKYGDEVRVLGKTGMMFNMSGVAGTQTGLNEDGTLNFSETESMDYDEAIELREEFPETAGLQCIGVGIDHIRTLLRSDVIDYVIPYHTSGLNATLRRMGDIYGWKDFTQTQHATEDKSIKKENAVDPEHWHQEPVFSEFFVGYDTGLGGVEAMRESAENYKRMCKERGLKPKFLEFANEPNYWKLLIDRKMVNQKTNTLIKQKPVVPNFDFDVIKDIVKKYVDNYDSGLENRAFQHIVDNWGNIPKRIRDLKKQGGTKKKSTKKAIDTLANQPIAVQPKDEQLSKRATSNRDSLYEERTTIRNRINELSKTKKELETSEEYNSIIDSIISASTDQEKKDVLNKYNVWANQSKYSETVDELESLQKKDAELNKTLRELADQEAVEKERKNIEASGLSDADYFRKVAVKEFGYTPYFYDAGYLLPSGKMLNFSGEKGHHYGSRGQDHRAIGIVYANVTGGKAMLKFMSEGNIRVMAETPGLDISSVAEPTKEQYSIIKKFVREYAKEKYIAIDITDANGNVVGTYEYENNINADRVVNDIKYFFENGTMRAKSSIADFRYSKRDTSYAPTFYSHMGKVIDGIRLEKMGANGVVSYLKGKGVKDEEIKWSGIEAFLEGKKSVTKAELQEFAVGSQLRIEESRSGINNYAYNELDSLWYDYSGYYLEDTFGAGEELNSSIIRSKFALIEEYGEDLPPQNIQDLMADLADNIGRPTKWEDYKLNGGSNYRELIFKMPNSTYSNDAMQTHWGRDAEGILAHARIQDMTTSDGKKMLFIEEIQSDWHNEGRNEGYGDTKKAADLKLKALALDDTYKAERRSLTEILAKHLEGRVDAPEAAARTLVDFNVNDDRHSNIYVHFIRKYDIPIDLVSRMNKLRKTRDEAISLHSQSYDLERGIPDAPFRNTYHEYVLKRLIRMAAEEGYDSIGWTPADIQSKRWSDEYAEGYRIEYDQDIPKFLRKYGKRWGATVGKERIGEYSEQFEVDLETMEDSDELLLEEGVKYDGIEVWSMSIPESMKDSVLYEGQTQYSKRNTSKKAYEDNPLIKSVIDTENDYKARGSWSSKAIVNLYKDNPEYDYLRRIYKGDKTAISELEDLVAQIEDTEILDSLLWYPVYVYGVEARKTLRKAINSYKKVINSRIQAIMEATVNGTDVGMEVRKYELSEIRSLFDSLNTNADIGKLADKVFKLAERLDLDIRGLRSIDGESNVSGSSLFEQVAYRVPYFNDKGYSDQNKATTILHELIHSCTSYAIEAKERNRTLDEGVRQGVLMLESIYNQIKTDPLFKGEYGLKNIREMIAELSNPEFRDKLQQRSLWQRIIDALKSLLGIQTKTGTYLEGAELALNYMLDNFDSWAYDLFVDDYSRANRRQGKMLFSEIAENTEAREFADSDVQYSLRKKAPPKQTKEGYKVFVVKDGKLYPPMVANPNAESTPIGVWLDADVGTRAPDSKTGRPQVKAGGKGTQGGSGSLAFRPGWHLGETPLATQFDRLNPETGVKELFPENFVWALCDIAADYDYQEEAMSYGYTKNGKFQHSLAGLPKLPTDGYYKYRTNPNPDTVPWLITGAMKVKKLLSDAEVNSILEAQGLPPKQRVGGNKTLADLGLSEYESKVFSDDADTQLQYRTKTFSDREVLQLASEEIKVEDLTQAEKDALDIFKKRLAKLESLQEERKEKGSLWHEQQFGENGDRAKANETLKRMQELDKQIQKAMKDVLSVEEKEVLSRVLKKARKVVETHERERNQDILKRWRDRRDNAADIKKYRDRIRKDVEDLYNWIQSPNNKSITNHVPEVLRDAVVPFLSSINFMSKRALNGGDATKSDEAFIKNLYKVQEAVKSNISAYGLYSGYTDLPEDFMETLDAYIKVGEALMKQSKGDFIINQMTSEELKTLSSLVANIKQYIKNFNRFLYNSMYQHVYDAGDDSIGFLERLNDAGDKTGSVSNFLFWQQIRPAYAFERFGKGGEAIYDGLRRGFAKLAFNGKEIVKFTEETYTDKEVNEWENDIKEFRLGSDILRIPVSYIMGLHELYKDPDGKRHILEGGVRVATYTHKGKKISDNGHTITLGEFLQITGTLTDRQKEVADKLQKHMAEKGAEWGNYVTVARFGEEQFTNPNYYPINSDGRYLPATVEEHPSSAALYALLNMSFTKQRNEKANNRVVIYSIFDVFANHMASMSQYNAMALPILDTLKWFNYEQVSIGDDGTKTILGSLRREMARVYGVPEETKPGSGKAGYAEAFVTNIIKDFNGTSAHGTQYDTFGLKALRVHNMAQVAYNIRVIAQQPFAITRAGMLISYKSILKGLKMSPKAIKKNVEEMRQYSGIAAWKSLGFYDVNISRGLTQVIKHSSSIRDKIADVGMWGAEKADTLTWAAMWNACKEEVIKKQKLTPESEGFYEAVTKLFEDVIYKTQVVDSILTKNEYMRDKGFVARAIGSFMSESTTNASMLLDAVDKYNLDLKRGMSKRDAWQKNGKMIGRRLYVYGVGAVLISIATAFVDALRDDDDYEEWYEKWLDAFGGNVFDELMPFNKLPIVSDFYDLAKEIASIFGADTYGNPPQSVIMQWYDSLINGTEIIADKIMGEDSNYTWYGGIAKLLQAASSMTGLPMASATREAITLWNNTVGAMAPSLKVHSYEPSEMSKIRNAYTEGNLTYEEAVQHLLEQGLVDTEDEAYFTVQGWEAGEGYSRFDAIFDAVLKGESIDEAMTELTSHGYTEKDVQSSIKSQIGKWYYDSESDVRITKQQAIQMLEKYTDMDNDEITSTINKWSCEVVTGIKYNDIGDEFIKGNITSSRAIEMYMRYGGLTKDEATEKIEVLKFVKEHPEMEGISYSAVNGYNTYCKPNGVPIETFYKAWKYKGTLSGTVKEQMMDYINSLNLSSRQKDSLYLAFGWAESKLNQAPWH